MSSYKTSAPEDAVARELRELLCRDEASATLPPWFASRLVYEAGRRARHPAREDSRWAVFLDSLLTLRVAFPMLVVTGLAGALLGYRGATHDAVHLAEVRYLDEIDPVHRHP
jgi:predicted nucleic acid-binding protein